MTTTTIKSERTTTEQPVELGVRPQADLFPLMEGPEFEALVEDIRVNGQRQPIVLHTAETCPKDC
jgi:hypothetical protein